MFSSKYIEIRAGSTVSSYDFDKIVVSCSTLDAPSICTVEQYTKIDDSFKNKIDAMGISVGDPRYAIMETNAS